MRVATREQLNDREQELRQFAKKHDYEITDFVIEQRSGLAAYSETLNGLLQNQSVRNILMPNISGLSKKHIRTARDFENRRKNNKISSAQTEAVKATRYTDDLDNKNRALARTVSSSVRHSVWCGRQDLNLHFSRK